MIRLESLAPHVLRIGVAILFLWFGMSQLANPADWVSWLPSWSSAIPVSSTELILLNGAFETIFGAALALGFFTRIAAFLLALHLFLISWDIGISAIGVRDFSLAMSTLALALLRTRPAFEQYPVSAPSRPPLF